jgi:hypothetical protein
MEVLSHVSSNVTTLVQNKEDWIIALSLIVVLYISMGIPKLSSKMVRLFSKPIVKFLFLVLVVYLATKNPSLSLILGVALLIIIQTINSQKLVSNLVAKTSVVAPSIGDSNNIPSANVMLTQSNQVNDTLPKLEQDPSVPIGNEKQDINAMDYPFKTELEHVSDSNPPCAPSAPVSAENEVTGYDSGDYAQA